MKYRISKIGYYRSPSWSDMPYYHNDYSMEYDPGSQPYYVITNLKTGKQLPSYFDTREEAKKRVKKLMKK